jgi:hypothetical protein
VGRIKPTLLFAVLSAAAVLGLISPSAGRAVAIPLPSYRFIVEARLRAADLPAREAVPVGLNLSGRLELTEDKYSPEPPALRKFQIEGERHLRFATRGIPTCGPRRLPNTPPPWEKCADALVGRGVAEVEFHYPETTPITLSSGIAAYNGGVRDGATKLWISGYFSAPLSRAVVVPVEVRKVKHGRYGWEAVASVPVLGEGFGSLISFNLNLQKRILLARCPRGSLQTRVTTSFLDGTTESSTLIRSCGPPS